MGIPSAGEAAPDFTAPADGGGSVRLSDLRGKRVVLYFYPKDFTPGCTLEACDFRDAAADFAGENCVILGVSADSVGRHESFSARHGLPFRLLSDTDHSISEAYGAWREKTLFGRKYMGIVRSTFLVDEQGDVLAAFDKVRVRGHAAQVLAAVRKGRSV